MHMPDPRHLADRVHVPHALRRPNPVVFYFVLVESVFWAGCAVWMAFSLSRLATGVKSQARLKALKSMPDAFTEEERTELIHKTKSRLLGPL